MPADSDRLGISAPRRELHRIASWWLEHAIDTRHGGFAGEIDYYGRPVAGANKSIVLHSRILWFFSAAAEFTAEPAYRDAADRAFHYLLEHFDDHEHGGAFWELACDGSPVDDKKQTYAMCFCLYALVAYFRLSANVLARDKALQYFELLETQAKDPGSGGYFEAFARDWRPRDDVRLAAGEMNAPRTMNTHLHLVEAYTALHNVVASAQTRAALQNAIETFCNRIINAGTGRLDVYFDQQWNVLSAERSFGHDIEASWLLWEAAETLGDTKLLSRLRLIVERLADACHRESFGDDGAGYHCVDGSWWVQAEAMIGFLNAFELSGEQRYRSAADHIWRYIGRHLIDSVGGEWHWLSTAQQHGSSYNYKAGPWKGPYHNGRAMIEACRRLARLQRDQH